MSHFILEGENEKVMLQRLQHVYSYDALMSFSAGHREEEECHI